MKKFLIILLSLVLIVFCAGCGTYSPAKSDGSFTGTGSGNTGKPNDPDAKPDDPSTGSEGKGIPFKVTLSYKDPYTGDPSRFYPSADMDIKAQWIGADGIHSAPFVNGTATAILDGDYRVSLSNLDNKYAYDPNGLEVNNNNPNIAIELMSLTTPNKLAGRDMYDGGVKGIINIGKLGAYRVTLNNASDRIYFQYAPEQSGNFLIESLVDTTLNEVNPTVYLLRSTQKAAKYWQNAEKIDDGGAAGTVTKNFRFEFGLSKGLLGNVCAFYIEANSPNSNGFPAEITIKVTYIGDYEDYKTVLANGPFYTGSGPDKDTTWQWSYRDNPQKTSSGAIIPNKFVTDGSHDGEKEVGMRFKLYEQSIGGDGFYHLYDEALYASNGGWGPLLWAKIWNSDTEIYKAVVDAAENPPVLMGTEDDYFIGADKSHTEFPEKRNYSGFWSSYSKYAINNAHPVNQEIMEALQFQLVANQFFYDGMGDAELDYKELYPHLSLPSKPVINSYNDFMFLAVCGYYKK